MVQWVPKVRADPSIAMGKPRNKWDVNETEAVPSRACIRVLIVSTGNTGASDVGPHANPARKLTLSSFFMKCGCFGFVIQCSKMDCDHKDSFENQE